MDELLAEAVRRRTKWRCEYCQASQQLYITPFQIEHVIARQHGGLTIPANLALACLHCNAHKGPNIAGLDALTRKLTRLFNPRRNLWERHFRWDGPYVIGKTAIGRVTICVLAMNDTLIVEARQRWIEEGVFPPSQSKG